MSDSPLLFERDGAIARLVLNRPEMGNAIDVPLAKALMEAAIVCDEDDTIRCVVLTGAGRMFCAGGDVGGFVAAGDGIPSLLKELTAYVHMAVSRLSRMAKPLLTVVNGPAAGAGLSLAILGDVALAGKSAKFAAAYGAIGLSPDGGMTWLLPRLVGLRRAQEIVLTNKRLSADEAAAIGLVSRVIDDADLMAEAAMVAAQLAASAIRAVGRTRNLLAESFGNSLEAHLEQESRAIALSGRDGESRAGVAAFLGKRAPDFTR